MQSKTVFQIVDEILIYSPPPIYWWQGIIRLLFLILSEVIIFSIIYFAQDAIAEKKLFSYVLVLIFQFLLAAGYFGIDTLLSSTRSISGWIALGLLGVGSSLAIILASIESGMPMYMALAFLFVGIQFIVAIRAKSIYKNLALFTPFYRVGTLLCVYIASEFVTIIFSVERFGVSIAVFLVLNIAITTAIWLLSDIAVEYRAREQIVFMPVYIFTATCLILVVGFLLTLLGVM